MAPTPSKFYHAEPGACPYHLIIGIDRRPPNKVTCTSERNLRKNDGAETVSELADTLGLTVRVMSLILKAAKVAANSDHRYDFHEAAEAVKRLHTGDLLPAAEVAREVGIHPKQFYEIVKAGYVKPAMLLASIALYSIDDVRDGMHARSLKVQETKNKTKAVLAETAKANKRKGFNRDRRTRRGA